MKKTTIYKTSAFFITVLAIFFACNKNNIAAKWEKEKSLHKLASAINSDAKEKVNSHPQSTRDVKSNNKASDVEKDDYFISACNGILSEKETAILDSYLETLLERGEFQRAFNLVNDNVGAGAMRAGFFNRLGLSSRIDVDAALEAATKLTSQIDRNAFKRGFIARFSSVDFQPDSITKILASSTDLKYDLQSIKMGFLQGYLSHDITNEQKEIFLIERLALSAELDKLESTGLSESLCLMLAEINPFEAWKTVGGIDKTSKTSDLRNRIIDSMFNKDPSLAIEQLSKEPDSPVLLARLFQSMANKDIEAAHATFEKYSKQLNLKSQEGIIGSFAGHYANSGQIAEAWKNVEKITDPAIKKQAEGQVWSKERDMVRDSVNKDPQQAITDLVSGKSQHDSYWIEEAMDVWMDKDFDNAEKWYQDNWKNLPADKAQYAAASFAKQAIKTGDIEVAEQWLPYIKDPKTKERIQAEVSKAAWE